MWHTCMFVRLCSWGPSLIWWSNNNKRWINVPLVRSLTLKPENFQDNQTVLTKIDAQVKTHTDTNISAVQINCEIYKIHFIIAKQRKKNHLNNPLKLHQHKLFLLASLIFKLSGDTEAELDDRVSIVSHKQTTWKQKVCWRNSRSFQKAQEVKAWNQVSIPK